ncbi:MAG: hypothetical protein IT357_15080 [Gemmatimonadaceae bacterium]|nr:hypothetical protein [Gemmatimonadaceae bacterium]
MHGSPLAHAVIGAVLLFTGAACGDSPTQAGANGPYAYVTIWLDHENGVLDSAGAVGISTIIDARGPYGARHLEVEEFRMTRRSDGGAFDWVEAIPGTKSALGDNGQMRPNWALRWTGSAGRLGLRDLHPGDTLDFTIATGRRSVVATLIVPGVPRLSHEVQNGTDVVRWQRVPGAAYYEVFAPSESDTFIYTSDSSLVISNRMGRSGAAPVIATVYDPGTARRKLNAFTFPETQDGVRYQFAATTSDRITLLR